MSAVLTETLAWTGALIALVLVLRRPVAQLCGPQYAYALWVLPLLRLLLPPITLPAWMAPAWIGSPVAAPVTESVPAQLAEPLAWQAETMPVTFAAPAPVDRGFDLAAQMTALPLLEALLLVWLGGAGVFLCRRFAAYFALRDDLLAEGREVGRARLRVGAIRLVETPGTLAPLAFGVLDPVIAMPPGFMALPDRRARDLALAHELAHHRGLDLVVNVLVQPLFALHWWNPLGHYGWLALRRDQEAACDARVVARASAEERAAYARLIAGFAAGPNLALAAPMACPVLGEKSIIHRLRSLSMSNLSPRRRFAGRALLAVGVLALPLTATISYAASEAEQAAPPAPPQPPLSPATPQAPEAPQPPEAPEAPEAPSIMVIVPATPEDESDTEVTEQVWRDADGQERRVKMVVRKGPDMEEFARNLEQSGVWNDAQQAEMVAALEQGLAEAERVRAELPKIIAEAMASAEAARAVGGPRVIVKQECRGGNEEVTETTTKDGTQIIAICQKRIFASARKGLEEARAEIAGDKDIPADTRKQLLRTLESQIARWKEKEG